MIYTEILLAYWYEIAIWIGIAGMILTAISSKLMYILAVKKMLSEQKIRNMRK